MKQCYFFLPNQKFIFNISLGEGKSISSLTFKEGRSFFRNMSVSSVNFKVVVLYLKIIVSLLMSGPFGSIKIIVKINRSIVYGLVRFKYLQCKMHVECNF